MKTAEGILKQNCLELQWDKQILEDDFTLEVTIPSMKEYAQERAIEFLEWTVINGWIKLDAIWEFSDGDSHRTTNELYILFESVAGGN